LKLSKLSLRGALATLLSLAIIASTFVFAVPVAADGSDHRADFPIQLIGASTINMSKTDMEALLNTANTYTDSNGNVFEGVPLQTLIGKIDGGDNSLNTSILGTYNIIFTGLDQNGSNYVKTAAAGAWSSAFTDGTITSNNTFIATKYHNATSSEFIDLPDISPNSSTKNWRPAIVSGSNIASSSYRVGGLYKIEITGLAGTAAVTVNPATTVTGNGSTFNVDININVLNAQSRGAQMNVTFDATKLICNSITEGTFYSAYASANGGSTLQYPVAVINNTSGTISTFGVSITEAGTGGPTGSGQFARLSFTAKMPNTSATFSPTNIVVSSATGGALTVGNVAGGTVTIGSALPDLVVFSSSEPWTVQGSTYTITYTIKNIGNVNAGASTTSVVIDGGTPMTFPCATLVAGASNTTVITAVQTLTGAGDTVVITADSAFAVTELNENNNVKTDNVWGTSSLGDTIIDGNIVSKIEITCPANVTGWNLIQGDNTIASSLNVKANNNYQVTASDQNGQTNGRMREFNGTAYGSAQLILPMHIKCAAELTDVTLAGPGTLVTAGPSTQDEDAGETFAISFDQHVQFEDPVIVGGNYYHIVVSFTAALVF
jgi:hypothetical protein